MACDMLVSLSSNLILNQFIFSSALSLVFSSTTSSSPNSSNCSSLWQSVWVYADHLRPHFSVSLPKALRSKARGCVSNLSQATCPEDSHSSFCFPFSSTEFLMATTNFSSFTVTGPDKVAYLMLKHLPRSGMDFFPSFLIFPGLFVHLLPSERHLLIFSFIKWESLSTILVHSCLSLSSPASQRFLNVSFYRVHSSSWSLIPFSLPLDWFAPWMVYPRSILYLCGQFRMGLTHSSRVLRQFLVQSISLKLSTLSSTPVFDVNLFQQASHLALLVEINLSFLTGALARFSKITKVSSFESAEVFRKDPFLNLRLFSSVRCSFYADDLAIWFFFPSVPAAVKATRGALVCALVSFSQFEHMRNLFFS